MLQAKHYECDQSPPSKSNGPTREFDSVPTHTIGPLQPLPSQQPVGFVTEPAPMFATPLLQHSKSLGTISSLSSDKIPPGLSTSNVSPIPTINSHGE